MMHGIGLFRGLEASTHGRHISAGNIHDQAQIRVEHLKDKIDAGIVDPERLQHRLEHRFGDAAAGIVGDDGSVDFARLIDVITEARAARLQHRLERRFGEDAAGIVGPDGSIDIARLRELVADKLIERIEAGDVDLERLERRLTYRFGDAAKDIFGEDGEVDIEALRALITGVEPAADAAAADPSENPVEAILAELTGEDGEIDPNKLLAFVIDQLREKVDSGELAPEDLGGLVTALFGDAAEGVVGADGTVDFDALEALISANGPEALRAFLTAGFGEDNQDIVNEDGTIDRDALVEFLTAQLDLAADPLEATDSADAEETGESADAGEDGAPWHHGGAFGEGGLAELRDLLGLLDGRWGGRHFAHHGFGHHHRPFFSFWV